MPQVIWTVYIEKDKNKWMKRRTDTDEKLHTWKDRGGGCIFEF